MPGDDAGFDADRSDAPLLDTAPPLEAGARDAGRCTHHIDCPAGQYCDPMLGCRTGAACATVADCMHGDPCLVPSCEAASRTCQYAVLDGDADGFPPIVCGGTDCDDSNPAYHPGATDECDGIDADCSGGPDAADAPGCALYETCDGTGCVCPSANLLCPDGAGGSVCADVRIDTSHCGDCTTACSIGGAACVSGSCQCPAGQTVCVDASSDEHCADLTQSAQDCGGCNVGCGLEATCVSSTCRCPGTQTFCPADAFSPFPTCGDLASDWEHCGACATRCLSQSPCSATCALSAGGLLRAFGGMSTSSQANASEWARDEVSGEIYAIVQQPSYDFHELPSGPTLFHTTTASEVYQFDASGSYVRRYGGTARVATVAARNGVIVIGVTFSTATSMFAGTMLTRPAGTFDALAVVSIAAATGMVSSVRTFATSDALAVLTALSVGSAGELALAGLANGTVDLGSGPLALGDRQYGFFATYDAAGMLRSARRVSGQPLTITRDASSAMLLGVDLRALNRPTMPFSVGGAMISGATADGYVAHYAADGTHLHSFLVDDPENVVLLSDGVASAGAGVQRYTFAGDSATLTTDLPMTELAGLRFTGLAVAGTRLVGVGDSHGGYTFGTRTVTTAAHVFSDSNFVATFDLPSLTPHALGHVFAQYSTRGSIGPVWATSATRVRIGGEFASHLWVGSAQLDSMPDVGVWLADVAVP